MTFARPRHCVVIGAGVLGAAVAARLAGVGSGVRVTLLDQDQPGRATSRRSFAWLNSNDKSPRPYHDLNHAGIRAWAELAPDLDGTPAALAPYRCGRFTPSAVHAWNRDDAPEPG